jgi:hypothetical protein
MARNGKGNGKDGSDNPGIPNAVIMEAENASYKYVLSTFPKLRSQAKDIAHEAIIEGLKKKKTKREFVQFSVGTARLKSLQLLSKRKTEIKYTQTVEDLFYSGDEPPCEDVFDFAVEIRDLIDEYFCSVKNSELRRLVLGAMIDDDKTAREIAEDLPLTYNQVRYYYYLDLKVIRSRILQHYGKALRENLLPEPVAALLRALIEKKQPKKKICKQID